MSEPLVFSVPDELVEVIAQRAAALVLERLGGRNGSPWMSRERASAYLDLPVSRLEKDRTLPCHREGRRVLYHRGELDEWLLNDGRAPEENTSPIPLQAPAQRAILRQSPIPIRGGQDV